LKNQKKVYQYIGILFLLLQLGSVVYARFIPEKFFCWAPYDEHTYYKIKVSLNGEELSTKEVKLRYNYLSDGWEPRSIDNVFSLVQQYETTYGKAEKANVEILYNTNGNGWNIWRPIK
jgi:hypothetical protein